MKIEKNRVYHHYQLWEDHKCGFYNNCSGKAKKEKIKKVIEMFNSIKLTRKYMNKVIDEWKYSCEHNFTNPSLNRIAYLGQAACCLYSDIPNTITMEAWNMLDKKVKHRSNMIAEEVLSAWVGQNGIQLCLNID